jgi:putative ABC transport system substrate-binding protein
MSDVADLKLLYRGVAEYVDRILKGEDPGDLPVQMPAEFDLRINARTAAALDLAIPDHLRLMATEIIE